MARVVIDYTFAAIPLEAIGDADLDPPVFELYCLLFKLGYLQREFTIAELCTMLAKVEAGAGTPKPPSRRSIYRWLTAMEAAGWLTWSRGGGDHHRFTPHRLKGVSPMTQGGVSPESHVILMTQGCDSGDTGGVSPESHIDRDLGHSNAFPEKPKNPEKNPEESGGGGGFPAREINTLNETDTSTVFRLRSIGVKPKTCTELADLPSAAVDMALTEAQFVDVVSLPAYVVSFLRDYRTGWRPPARTQEQPHAPDPTRRPRVSQRPVRTRDDNQPPPGLKIAGRARPADSGQQP